MTATRRSSRKNGTQDKDPPSTPSPNPSASASSKSRASQSQSSSRSSKTVQEATASEVTSDLTANFTAKEKALLKKLQAKSNGAAAALLKAQDEDIRKRNAALLEEEDTDNDNENGSQAKKKQKTQVSARLDDEERQLAASLGNQDISDKEGSDADHARQSSEEKEKDEIEIEPYGEDDPDHPNNLAFDEDNGVQVRDPKQDKSRGGRRSHSVTSRASSMASSRASSPTATPRGSSKVVLTDFPSDIRSLANLAKACTREAIAIQNGFPGDIDTFCWESIQVAGRSMANMEDAVEAANVDVDLRELLITYASYAITGLRGELKSKSKLKIAGHYGISTNTSAIEVQKLVRWLRERSNFMFGGMDLKNQKVDRQQPFCHPIITDMISQQWFGKGKADAQAYKKMVAQKKIFGRIIVLTVTAVECAIMEFETGVHHKVAFSEETMTARYSFHWQSWSKLERDSPKWALMLEKKMFMEIVNSLNKSHLHVDADNGDLDDLDFAQLEASAEASVADS